MVDLIEFLDNTDDTKAMISILLIMILQSPVLTFPGYVLMIYAGFKFGLITGASINFLGLYLLSLSIEMETCLIVMLLCFIELNFS